MSVGNPALEAAIEANPDDVDAYHVYGDWLQTEGDPRGELIALQAAAARDPSDKKLAQRADKYLKEHGKALLGTLVDFKKLDLRWRCGFIRGVEIDVERPLVLRALDAVLAHPSCRFLTSLRVSGKDPQTAAVVERLLEAKRPATLTELELGGLTDEMRDQLRAVFPRLGRSHGSEWETILATLAEQRRTDLKYAADALPALQPLPGISVGVTPPQVLGALKLELDKAKPIGAVAALKRAYSADSLDRFALELGRQFVARDEPAAMKWGFLAIGKLGGGLAATWIGERIRTWSHQRAVQGIGLLSEIGTPEAVLELYAITKNTALNRPRRTDAVVTLANLAKQRKLTTDQLLDRSMPAVLTAERTKAATSRLLDIMIDGYRMEARDFLRHVVTHPGIGPLAERVVWASFDGRDVETTFRSTGERVVDLDGTPVDLDDARIGIVHPAELDPTTRGELASAWREAFEALEITPLFSQLDRTVYAPKPQDEGAALTRFKLRFVGFDELRTAFERLDWVAEREDDEHWGAPEYTRYFRRDNVHAIAHIVDGAIGVVNLRRDGRIATFEKLSPVTQSELLGDLEAASSRARQEEPVGPPADIDKGARVEITRGSDRGMRGVVFWLGDGNNGARCGLRGDDGETYWADLSAVKQTDAPAPDAPAKKPTPAKRPVVDDDDDDAPVDKPAGALAFAKGTKVNWKRGKHSGTGVVFWLGKNKFGEGMRAGLKDDETGETVWADAADCTPRTTDED